PESAAHLAAAIPIPIALVAVGQAKLQKTLSYLQARESSCLPSLVSSTESQLLSISLQRPPTTGLSPSPRPTSHPYARRCHSSVQGRTT
ncbi:hypothetical protein H4S07_005390, partial [Coemansia furcata]